MVMLFIKKGTHLGKNRFETGEKNLSVQFERCSIKSWTYGFECLEAEKYQGIALGMKKSLRICVKCEKKGV